MRVINSDALTEAYRALGIKGGGAAPETALRDKELYQNLVVNEIVRRSRTVGRTEGIFSFLFSNDHSGSGTLTTTITPYNATVGAANGWPVPVPDDLEVWLIGAGVEQDGGTGTLEAGLFLFLQSAQMGVGEDDAGVAIAASSSLFWLARWNALTTLQSEHGLDPDGKPWIPLGLRLPRLQVGAGAPTNLLFRSTASAAAKFDCTAIMGLFPIAFGQDILVGAA